MAVRVREDAPVLAQFFRDGRTLQTRLRSIRNQCDYGEFLAEDLKRAATVVRLNEQRTTRGSCMC